MRPATTHSFLRPIRPLVATRILATAVASASACGDPNLSDDAIERTITPPKFFLASSDASVEFQIAACTDGVLDDFSGYRPDFEVDISGFLSATAPTELRVTLSPSSGVDPATFERKLTERTRVDLSADFGLGDRSDDLWCSDWGTYTVSKTGPESMSRVDVQWTITARVLTDGEEPSLEVYVR